MGIIVSIIMGLIAGFIAKAILPGKEQIGLILTVVLGMVGGFVGSIIAMATGLGSLNAWGVGNLLFAVLGAVVVLAGWRILKKAQN